MYLLRACCRVSFVFHILSPMNFQPLCKSTYCHWQGERALLATHLPHHLENDFQLDRRTLSQIIENRKVAARKLLFFRNTNFAFCLKMATLQQSHRGLAPIPASRTQTRVSSET